MIAGQLEVVLLANMARLQKDMDDAKRSVGGAMASIEKSVASAKAALGGLAGGLSAAAFAAWVKGAIDGADAMNDLSKSTDIAVGKLAGLKLMAKQTGGDLEGTAQAINKLSLNMGKDAEKYAKIGITAKEPLEAFKQFSDVFVSIKDPQLRAAVAAEALGKSWAGAAPALSEGSKSIQEMIDKGELLSGMNQDAADASDEFNDRLAELQTSLGGTALKIATGVLPLMTALAEDLTDTTDKTNGLSSSFNPLNETLRALIVLGGNVSFVLKGVGTEIGGMAAQIAAIGRGDFKGALAIGDMMKADAEKSRAAFDAWEAKMMAAGTAASATAKAAKAASAELTGVQKSALKAFVDPEATKKANEELKKQHELLAKLAGVNGDYMEQLTRLQVVRAKGRLTEEQYVEAIKKLIGLQPEAKKQMEEMEKAAKDLAEARADLRRKEQQAIDDYFQSQTEGYNAAIKGSKDALKAAQDEYAQFGMSKSQIAEITLYKLESAKASFLEGSEGYNATQKQIEAQKELIGVLKKIEEQQEWKSIFDSIDRTAHDTFVSIFDSGKNAFDRLRDALKNGLLDLLYQMTLKKWIFSIGASVSGIPGIANAAGWSSVLGTMGSIGSTYSGLSSLGGMANAVGLGGAYSTVAGWFGATGMGLTGAGSIGGASSLASMGLAGGGMGAPIASTVATEAAGASGIMGSIGTAMPYLAAAAAIYAIAKSLDHSGTYHTGALAEYSAASGLLTGSNGTHAGPRAGDTNYGTGFGGVDFSQQTADFVGGISKSIVGILDSTASTFGKTAGYTAATAFADDTSKDGAWGALLIQKMGQSVVNWNDTRNSSWAPREFGDGEAGRTQYLAELSKSVRTALDDIGLPGWAQSMLDNLGNAPALTDLAAVVDKINAVQNSLVSMGTAIAGFSNLSDGAVSALISASGGVDAFTSGMSAFYQGYYTDAEKLANVSSQVSDALSAVGLQMPQTREEFRDLVQANLALGEAGAPAVAALLKVSGAFGTIADSATAASDRENALAKSRSDLEIQIMELSGDSSGALAAKRALELAGIDASLRPLQERIYLLQDEKTATDAAKVAAQTALNDAMKGVDAAFSAVQRAVDAERKSITDAYNDQIKAINASITDVTGSVGKLTSLSNSLRSTIDRMRLSSDLGSDRSGAMAQIQSVLAIAKAGGVFPDAESIASALNTISQPFDQLFGNATDYKRELMRQKDVLGQLADLTDSQKSIQERTLESLQDQLKVTEQGYSDEMTRLDGVLSAAQLQIDTLRGIDQSVMSVAAAIANLQINVGTAATAQANLSALTGTQPDSITGLYSNILGRQADATGAAFWQNALITNPKSWDGVVTDFINGALTGGTQSDKENALAWARANHIPGFAVGTSYVPYDMTARIHAGEEITPRPYVDIQRADRSRTNDLLSQLVEENRSMRAEIALLHSDNSAENRAIAQHANKTAKLMERAMPDGDAIATRAAA